MSIYYDPSKLMGYNRLFSFVIGARGIGKTYAFKSWAIRDFLQNGRSAWWVMRYKTETDKIVKDGRFFADVAAAFPGVCFKIDGAVGYLKKSPDPKDEQPWQPFINFQSLSESAIKAISDPACSKIVFDEFIPLPGIRYLSNEVERFLEFYFTISRGRDVRAFFLANNVTSVSPYFTYFKVKPGKEEFAAFPEIVIQNARQLPFTERMKSTRFGHLVAGTKYAAYAIDNESFADTDAFIGQMPPRSREIFNLKSQYGIFTVYICQPTSIYIKKRTAPVNDAVVYAVDMTQHDETTVALSAHAQMVRSLLSDYYAHALMIFESQETKAEFVQSFEHLIFKK